MLIVERGPTGNFLASKRKQAAPDAARFLAVGTQIFKLQQELAESSDLITRLAELRQKVSEATNNRCVTVMHGVTSGSSLLICYAFADAVCGRATYQLRDHSSRRR